jgi:hypothetical protein
MTAQEKNVVEGRVRPVVRIGMGPWHLPLDWGKPGIDDDELNAEYGGLAVGVCRDGSHDPDGCVVWQRVRTDD